MLTRMRWPTDAWRRKALGIASPALRGLAFCISTASLVASSYAIHAALAAQWWDLVRWSGLFVDGMAASGVCYQIIARLRR